MEFKDIFIGFALIIASLITTTMSFSIGTFRIKNLSKNDATVFIEYVERKQ